MDGVVTSSSAVDDRSIKSSASFDTCPLDVVPVTIIEDRIEEGARELLGHVRPDWRPNDTTFTLFTAGYSNTLVGCRLRDDTGQDTGDDTVLVRVYGRGNSMIIDRDQEINSMLVMHAIGSAAPVYCRFNNGIAYGYQPGVMLDNVTVRRPEMQKLIADELALMHSIDITAVCDSLGYDLHFDSRPSLFRSLRAWIQHIPDSFADDQKQSKLKALGFSKQQLVEEVESLERTLVSLDSPVVFCHNDLLPKNIIYDQEQQKVHFIDFEFVAYNYQAFDIANHFCEYAGMENVDFSLYPSRDYQINWLRTYLESLSKYRGPHHSTHHVTDIDVERLFVHVQKFALASHLYWAFWALIQAEHSIIDYDYLDFACIRLTEYRARKTELLSYEMP